MEGQNLISLKLMEQTNVFEYLITKQDGIRISNHMDDVLTFLISKGKMQQTNRIIQT